MHEMGIAQSVLGIVEQEMAARPGARLLTVTLGVGEMSGVDSESLRFCFECLTRETPLESVRLCIERTNDGALDVRQMEMEVPDGAGGD